MLRNRRPPFPSSFDVEVELHFELPLHRQRRGVGRRMGADRWDSERGVDRRAIGTPRVRPSGESRTGEPGTAPYPPSPSRTPGPRLGAAEPPSTRRGAPTFARSTDRSRGPSVTAHSTVGSTRTRACGVFVHWRRSEATPSESRTKDVVGLSVASSRLCKKHRIVGRRPGRRWTWSTTALNSLPWTVRRFVGRSSRRSNPGTKPAFARSRSCCSFVWTVIGCNRSIEGSGLFDLHLRPILPATRVLGKRWKGTDHAFPPMVP